MRTTASAGWAPHDHLGGVGWGGASTSAME
ncbi:Uncharacterised protein [Mycobacteroides abscessus subsp. abscessus]|nr:Uncharacterised protein [Mycobacteroides abscessus subsp. abscessus]